MRSFLAKATFDIKERSISFSELSSFGSTLLYLMRAAVPDSILHVSTHTVVGCMLTLTALFGLIVEWHADEFLDFDWMLDICC